MAVKYTKVGPGTLTIGEIGSLKDFSCQVTSATLVPSKDQDDNLNVLCGDVVPGDINYTWTLEGELIQDLSSDGVVKFCMENAGKALPFSYEPNVNGPTLSGELIVDPVGIGGEANTKATSDFEFSVVGTPVWDDGDNGS